MTVKLPAVPPVAEPIQTKLDRCELPLTMQAELEIVLPPTANLKLSATIKFPFVQYPKYPF